LLNLLLLYLGTVLVHNLISMNYYSIYTIITIETCDDNLMGDYISDSFVLIMLVGMINLIWKSSSSSNKK